MLGASQDVVVDVPLPLEEHVAHAGVVGLMARYALDLVNQPKGRLGRTALSAGYSLLLWGYPMDG